MILGLATVNCKNESTKIYYKILDIIYLPRVNKYNLSPHNAAPTARNVCFTSNFMVNNIPYKFSWGTTHI